MEGNNRFIRRTLGMGTHGERIYRIYVMCCAGRITHEEAHRLCAEAYGQGGQVCIADRRRRICPCRGPSNTCLFSTLDCCHNGCLNCISDVHLRAMGDFMQSNPGMTCFEHRAFPCPCPYSTWGDCVVRHYECACRKCRGEINKENLQL